MKIVIAPDSFKGALRSPKVASAIAAGWHAVRRDDEIVEIPLADGGEGTAEALRLGTGGTKVTVPAHDALMRPIDAEYSILGDGETFVFEMATASGIELLTPEELDPLRATTFGAGEVLLAALRAGAKKVVVGIGGSATVDGGAGFLQALGIRYYDANGNLLPDGVGGGDLERIERVDASALKSVLTCELTVACDVTNPLLGEHGTVAIFGPQKGVTPGLAPRMERNMRHWAEVLEKSGLTDVCDAPGDGAAGGLGFAMRAVLKATIRSGAGLVIALSGFDEAIHGAELVITGEGCSDVQTAYGKLCAVVAERAAAQKVPTALCAGALRGDTSELEKRFSGVFSIASGPGTLENAMAATGENLRRAGANLAALASVFSSKGVD
jgi:glycerate kinase